MVQTHAESFFFPLGTEEVVSKAASDEQYDLNDCGIIDGKLEDSDMAGSGDNE